MKLIVRINEYAHSKTVYLIEKMVAIETAIEPQKLVVIELPIAGKTSYEIINRNPGEFRVEGKGERAVISYVGMNLRRARLDDFLDAEVVTTSICYKDFSMEEYEKFFDEHKEMALEAVRAQKSLDGKALLDAYDRICKLAEKLEVVYYGLQNEVRDRHYALSKKLDYEGKSQWNKMVPIELLKAAGRAVSYEAKTEMGVLAFKRIFEEEKDPSAAIWKFIRESKDDPAARGMMNYWTCDAETSIKMRQYFRFPQTVKGETFELRGMKPMTLGQLPADIDEARFVGPVRLGRSVLYDEDTHTYVYGDKSLKFLVMKRGGKVQKYGNTLVVEMGDIETDLLLAEKLDALSFVAPGQLKDIKNRWGKKVDITDEQLAGITKDYKKAREVADMCLEQLYGIDPSVLRSLYRARKKKTWRYEVFT